MQATLSYTNSCETFMQHHLNCFPAPSPIQMLSTANFFEIFLNTEAWKVASVQNKCITEYSSSYNFRKNFQKLYEVIFAKISIFFITVTIKYVKYVINFGDSSYLPLWHLSKLNFLNL